MCKGTSAAVREWLSRWGVPDIITSDRGSQFVSDLWLEVCNLMGIARDPTTSYHHQHNGKIERMHRRLKNYLHARLLGRASWLSELPWVMLGLRAASNLDTGVSPSILVTGQQPTLPGQLVVQRARSDDASTFGRQLASAMAAQTFDENPWHEKSRSLACAARPVNGEVCVGAHRQSATVARSEVHRPISCSAPLGQVLSSAAGDRICRQTTTFLRG